MTKFEMIRPESNPARMADQRHPITLNSAIDPVFFVAEFASKYLHSIHSVSRYLHGFIGAQL
jgi:hypothetical protein